ncbi:hypothetical protein COO72_02550 [Bifidobacterium callitrichos]|nr:hypothetical protein COO72_02550 [Bifidobacterium callitrichos]
MLYRKPVLMSFVHHVISQIMKFSMPTMTMARFGINGLIPQYSLFHNGSVYGLCTMGTLLTHSVDRMYAFLMSDGSLNPLL